MSALTKFFFTQRLASGTITPIGDYTNTGFAFTSARRETAFGVETRFGKYTSMVGRYQLENGISGTDSFAVIGLQNRLPLTKKLSLELGFERGFHLTGPNESFNSATVGFGWQPNEDFRANARYEFRDRNGNGQLFTAGAAGRLKKASLRSHVFSGHAALLARATTRPLTRRPPWRFVPSIRIDAGCCSPTRIDL